MIPVCLPITNSHFSRLIRRLSGLQRSPNTDIVWSSTLELGAGIVSNGQVRGSCAALSFQQRLVEYFKGTDESATCSVFRWGQKGITGLGRRWYKVLGFYLMATSEKRGNQTANSLELLECWVHFCGLRGTWLAIASLCEAWFKALKTLRPINIFIHIWCTLICDLRVSKLAEEKMTKSTDSYILDWQLSETQYLEEI